MTEPELLHTRIEGRPATVAYFDDNFVFTTPDKGTLIKIIFDDTGERIFAVPNPPDVEVLDLTGEDWTEEEHPRGEAGRFSEKGAQKSEHADRVARATATHNPMTKEKKRIANEMEIRVASMVEGERTPDNQAFDVLLKGRGIEIKTIIAGKNDKITMHPDSLARKVAYAKDNHIQASTIVIDARESRDNPTVYYHEGVGSFRLQSMTVVKSMTGLKELYQ